MVLPLFIEGMRTFNNSECHMDLVKVSASNVGYPVTVL